MRRSGLITYLLLPQKQIKLSLSRSSGDYRTSKPQIPTGELGVTLKCVTRSLTLQRLYCCTPFCIAPEYFTEYHSIGNVEIEIEIANILKHIGSLQLLFDESRHGTILYCGLLCTGSKWNPHQQIAMLNLETLIQRH